jgi:hypothetical protein
VSGTSQRPLPTQDNTIQKYKDKHPCLKRDSNPRSQCSRDQGLCLRRCGHWDRHMRNKLAEIDITSVIFVSLSQATFVRRNLTTGSGLVRKVCCQHVSCRSCVLYKLNECLPPLNGEKHQQDAQSACRGQTARGYAIAACLTGLDDWGSTSVRAIHFCLYRLVRPTQPPVQRVPGVVTPGVERGQGVTLTTHPYLLPR